jgi:hypothetical protein
MWPVMISRLGNSMKVPSDKHLSRFWSLDASDPHFKLGAYTVVLSSPFMKSVLLVKYSLKDFCNLFLKGSNS